MHARGKLHEPRTRLTLLLDATRRADDPFDEPPVGRPHHQTCGVCVQPSCALQVDQPARFALLQADALVRLLLRVLAGEQVDGEEGRRARVIGWREEGVRLVLGECVVRRRPSFSGWDGAVPDGRQWAAAGCTAAEKARSSSCPGRHMPWTAGKTRHLGVGRVWGVRGSVSTAP